MSKSEILSLPDIDAFGQLLTNLEHFKQRLRATVAQAERGLELERAFANITSGHQSSSKNGASAKAPARSKAKALAAAVDTKPASGAQRKSPPKPGLDPSKVLEVLKKAPKKGLQVREVGKAVGESNTERVRGALRKLRDMKQAKSTGKTSQAYWHAAA